MGWNGRAFGNNSFFCYEHENSVIFECLKFPSKLELRVLAKIVHGDKQSTQIHRPLILIILRNKQEKCIFRFLFYIFCREYKPTCGIQQILDWWNPSSNKQNYLKVKISNKQTMFEILAGCLRVFFFISSIACMKVERRLLVDSSRDNFLKT